MPFILRGGEKVTRARALYFAGPCAAGASACRSRWAIFRRHNFRPGALDGGTGFSLCRRAKLRLEQAKAPAPHRTIYPLITVPKRRPLSEKRIHLIARALADPRRYEI